MCKIQKKDSARTVKRLEKDEENADGEETGMKRIAVGCAWRR
jgi:hypothetical protein